jgi:hypothetical protein
MKNLCRAIISSACFLELSEDDVVDPDSAVEALESIAATLQTATDDEKRAFREACREVAENLRVEQPGYVKTAEFVRGLPESLGL